MNDQLTDLPSLADMIDRIKAFGERCSALAKPFAWTFIRQQLQRRLRHPLLHLQPSISLPLAA